MNTKDLNLDASKIGDILNSLEGCACTLLKGNAQLDNYEILRKSDSSKTVISVYHKQGGKTTLVVGGSPKFKEFGSELAELIVSRTQTISLGKINDTIGVTAEDFKKLLEELDSFEFITEKEIAGGTEYTYNGDHKEKFVFRYYTKRNNLTLQGAPLAFSMKILALLDGMGYSATKNIIEKATEITLDTPDLWDEYMPHTKTTLPQILRDVIEPSMIYVKVTIPLTDYGSHLIPVMRGMESSMRRVLEDNNIEVGEKFDVFQTFKGSYIVNINHHDKIDDIIRGKVEKCYNFYKAHRDTLSHASDEILEIRCIDNRDEALKLLFESFGLMEELHAPI